MMQGVAEAGFRIQLLCAVSEAAAAAHSLESLAADFRLHWGVPVDFVHVAAGGVADGRQGGAWRTVMAPALDVYSQGLFTGSCSQAQATALYRALRAEPPALVFAHRLAAMALLRRAGGTAAPVVFDLDDVETQAFDRAMASPPHWRSKPLRWLQRPALARLQSWAVRRAARTLVCSEADSAALLRQHPASGVLSVPNAVPAPALTRIPDAPSVLFLGTYAYEPNVDAANHLVEHIWPLVRQQVPDAKLLIGGSHCQVLRGFAAPPPGVHYLGFVEDLNALYAQARVVVCPILRGSGTRIKIIEAALAGRPIVATTIGAEGLIFDAARGEISLRDDVVSFAGEVCRLLTDATACERMGNAALAVANEHYSAPAAVRLIAKNVAQACSGKNHAI